MMFGDDKILQVTYCKTNLPNNTVCRCYKQIRTDDGISAHDSPSYNTDTWNSKVHYHWTEMGWTTAFI